MNKITQTSRYRQSLIEYTQKHGVTKAAIRYRTNRQYVYRWLRRYDGTLSSLEDRSHRPHSHPNQHRPEELKLIYSMRRRNPHAGLVVFWVKLRQRGYMRSITGLFRVLRRLGQIPVKPPNPKYIPKPYEQMTHPGQRVQIDVKHVPAACLVGEAKGQKFYQYTAIDEFSRLRYLEAFEEASTFTSATFLKNAMAFFKKHGFTIECVQTDNGTEFTRRFSNAKPTLFDFLEQVVLQEIRRLTRFASHHEAKFAEMVMGHSEQSDIDQRKRKQRELYALTARDRELDKILSKCYEDNMKGKLTDERFARLDKQYTQEQKELAEKVKALQSELDKKEVKAMTADMFISTVRKYTRAKKLTERMLNELIERIEVHQAEKIDGIHRQKLTIHYNFIGAIEIPDTLSLPEISMQTRKGVTVSYEPLQEAV